MKRAWHVYALAALATILSFPWPPPPIRIAAALLIAFALTWSGLWLGARHGLGSSIPSPKRALWSLLIGAGAGAIVLAILPFTGLQRRLTEDAAVEAWKWPIISFNAAVLEEIVFRLFLVSLLVWIAARFVRQRTAFEIALLVSALAFGAAHLGRWTSLGPAVVTASMMVNAFAAIMLGLVYVKWGIEAAMISHFAADLVVHLIGSRLFA